jgi:hypothetical protein
MAITTAVMGVCQSCGAKVPTYPVTFRQNIGAIVIRFQRKVSGQLCTDCVDRHFWKMTGTTFAIGWLGLVSLIVTPFFLVLNIRDFLNARREFRVAGVGVDSRLALAALLAGLLSLFVCSPLVVPALVGIVLGVVALVRTRRDPESYGGTVPALLGIAASGASLVLIAVFVILLVLNEAKDPGERALRDADWKLDKATGEQSLGNSPQAYAMAVEVNDFCKNLGPLITKMGGPPGSGSADSRCVTYVEARPDKVCFLVHVPNLRQFSKQNVESAAGLFWQSARITAKKSYGRDDLKVAVGLRGSMLYGGVAVGMASGVKPTAVDTSALAYPPRLWEFFLDGQRPLAAP